MKVLSTSRARACGMLGTGVATVLVFGSFVELAYGQSPYNVECKNVRPTFRSADEVSSAFACKGDRSRLSLRALEVADANADLQSAIQRQVSRNLTVQSLRKAYALAQTSPATIRRFVGLGIIGNAVYPALGLSPVDTAATADWDPALTAHADSRTTPELKAQASRMLRELAKNASYEDVRRRSQQMLVRMSRQLAPPDSGGRDDR